MKEKFSLQWFILLWNFFIHFSISIFHFSSLLTPMLSHRHHLHSLFFSVMLSSICMSLLLHFLCSLCLLCHSLNAEASSLSSFFLSLYFQLQLFVISFLCCLLSLFCHLSLLLSISFCPSVRVSCITFIQYSPLVNNMP